MNRCDSTVHARKLILNIVLPSKEGEHDVDVRIIHSTR